jgi:hypothetical protein
VRFINLEKETIDPRNREGKISSVSTAA